MNLLRAAGYLKIGLVGMEAAAGGGAGTSQPAQGQRDEISGGQAAGDETMTMVAKSFLLPEEDPELRRWLMAAARLRSSFCHWRQRAANL